MKKLFRTFISALFLFVTLFTMTSCADGREIIAVVKLGSHTSLDEIEEAVETELTENMDNSLYRIKEYNCNFDSGTITQVISSLKTKKKVALVVAIATPVAAVAKSMLTDIPVVFAAVSDPVSSGIVENLDAPEGNVTGTSDAIDVSRLVELAYQVDAEVKNIGYIYTASEANSQSNLAKLRTCAEEKNFTLTEKTISNSAEITEAAESVLDDIDALIVTDDNNVASAMSVLAGLCRKKNVPVYCAADSEIKDGGMMGYSISYTKLGKETAGMALEILSGTVVSSVPVKVFSAGELSLYYNSDFLKNSSVVIPQELLDTATDLAE